MSRRVVVTGCAAITPIGNTREEILRPLTKGISGVEALRSDAVLTGQLHAGVFGSVDYPTAYDFSRHHRGAHVWRSFSPDLRNWGGHKLVLPARRGSWWDANRVGLSPPLIETPRGG